MEELSEISNGELFRYKKAIENHHAKLAVV